MYINSLELRDTGDSSTVIRTVLSAKQHELYDKETQVWESELFQYLFQYIIEKKVYYDIQINDIAILTLDQPVATITPVQHASNPSTTYAG